MADPYQHPEMPPVIRRTAQDEYQLEGQSGVVVTTYQQVGMDHPTDWWFDLITAIEANYDSTIDAIHDLTLLTRRGDWRVIDER